jgi:hypothetical protein
MMGGRVPEKQPAPFGPPAPPHRMARPAPRTPSWAWAALCLAATGTLISLGGAQAVLASNRDKPLRTPFWFAHVPYQGVTLALTGVALVRPGLAAVPAVAALACLTVLQLAFEAAGTRALAAIIGEQRDDGMGWEERGVAGHIVDRSQEKQVDWITCEGARAGGARAGARVELRRALARRERSQPT